MERRTLGIEREWFILKNGKIGPHIGMLLPELRKECEERGMWPETFAFELFAGQVEDRTPPVASMHELLFHLQENRNVLEFVGSRLGLRFVCADYVRSDELGELVVNPFDPRHAEIWKKITTEEKIAASQVAAVHVHIGSSIEDAVSVMNYCRRQVIHELVELGNFSKGKRMDSYRTMAKVYGDPPAFGNTSELLSYIEGKGGEKNVWDLVRYKPSTQTVEFRMFGTTLETFYIQQFVMACLKVFEESLQPDSFVTHAIL
jgi:hypothetical protein